jgi:hypothetical protein
MTPTKPPTLPQTAGDASPVKNADDRVRQIFRRSLREGRLHPLQHLIQRHRSAGAA